MTANDFKFEGLFGVKDGRKWKTRYCVFKQPNKLLDHFKLYLYKDRDDYERLKVVETSHFEDVLGYESGHVIDKDHPNCILMVGRRSVFFIGFPDFKQMIEWGQNLKIVLRCHFYRLTLEQVENNRNLPRQAGSLHIQRSRICFIREPENNLSKLVCAWDVREVKQCGIDPETRLFFIDAGTRAGKMRGKYFFSCQPDTLDKLHASVADTLNDRVLYQSPPQQPPLLPTGRSPPAAQVIGPTCLNPPPPPVALTTATATATVYSVPRRRASNSQLPPPPLPPPPPPPPPSASPLPPPPPPPPGAASPRDLRRSAHETLNGSEGRDHGDHHQHHQQQHSLAWRSSSSSRHFAAPLHTGSHECLRRGKADDAALFPNATLTRSGKKSSPGAAESGPGATVRHLHAEEEPVRSGVVEQRRGMDLFRRSNSLNIQSSRQDKTSSGNILIRIFKRRSRSETDFNSGCAAASVLTKDVASVRIPAMEPDGDDDVFDDHPGCSSASAASSSPPEGHVNALATDVTLSPIREDRTPSGPPPSINLSNRNRSVSASYSGAQAVRLPSTGSTTGNSTLKRADDNESVDSRTSTSPKRESKTGKEQDMVVYSSNPFTENMWGHQGTIHINSAPQTIPPGYVTLPSHARKGGGLQRSHSTVSGGSQSSTVPANTTLLCKPRFGNEYVPRQTLRSVSQCTADSSTTGHSSSGGSPLSTTPAMACPVPRRPSNNLVDPAGGHRHYVNFPPNMPGLIPSGQSPHSTSVAANTGYVNLDMRFSDDYAAVDLRPGHSAPECPGDEGCSPHLHYAKLHFNERGSGRSGSQTSVNAGDSGGSQSGSYQLSYNPQQRLSSSAEQSYSRASVAMNRGGSCDYIEVDTSRTKALSKLVSEQLPGEGEQLKESDDQLVDPGECLNGSQSTLETQMPPINDPTVPMRSGQDTLTLGSNSPSMVSNPSVGSSNNSSGYGSGQSTRNQSFRKFRNAFSTRKNSEAAS